MNESINQVSRKKRRVSIIFKASIIGSLLGGALTVIAIVLAFYTGGWPVLIYAAMPALYLSKLFGFDAKFAANNDFIFLILPFIINSFLFCIVGMAIGFLLAKFKKRTNN